MERDTMLKDNPQVGFWMFPRKWRIGIFLLSLLCVVLLILVVIFAVRIHKQKKGEEDQLCKSPLQQNTYIDNTSPNLFQDLTTSELKAVNDYLQQQQLLNLTAYSKATLRDNFIYSIELYLPKKAVALKYLDSGGAKPQRQARVIIFHGYSQSPHVQEYLVQYLPNPSKHIKLQLKHRKTNIPYYGRPFTFKDAGESYHTIRRMTEEAYPLLKESFGSWFHNCTNHCLSFFAIGEPARHEANKRYSWVQFMRNMEGTYLFVLPFQVLLEYSDVRVQNLLEVVYNNQKFDNVSQLMASYKAGTLKLVHVPVPNDTERLRASRRRRGPEQPKYPMRGPTLVEPNGKRFSVINNKVSYMNWQFEFGIRSTAGLAIYDVRFKNKRIAYEISLQEGVAYYSGYDPETSNTHYIDSTWGMGTSNTYLVKDIDCPLTAIFLDSVFFTATDLPVKNPQSVCIYETNTGTPLWRHFDVKMDKKSTGTDGMRFQGGLAGHALVIRVVSTPFNYDYMVDYIFHQSGTIEVRTTASGYINSAFATEKEKKYGFVNFFNQVGSVHDHFLLFKVDIDVAGVKNSYQTVDVVPRNVSYEWEANTYRFKKQVDINKKKREKDAVVRYDFDKPKYYVFINEDEKNTYGDPKGYRIDIQNKVKQQYPDSYYMNDVCAWSKYQLSVTKRSDLEPFGSAIYNQFTFLDPAFNFDSIINDNEAIEKEDLVGWVSIGGLHIPGTEDIPLTTTVGSSYGFLIKPFGYFDEDPSQDSTTSVYIENGKDGEMNVNTYGTPETSSCPVPKRKIWG